MYEIVMHRIWESQSFPINALFTTRGERIHVVSPGEPNSLSGPDFHHSKIRLGDSEWSGHVELHIKASDWYMHGHHRDHAYNAVILHVVWEADTEVLRMDGTVIPTLSLSELVSQKVLNRVRKSAVRNPPKELACKGLLYGLPDDIQSSWREELFWHRLEVKCSKIGLWLHESENDWEYVLFKALLKSFGLNLNGQAFLSLERALPFSVFRKLTPYPLALESVLFGLSGLLREDKCDSSYFSSLKREYLYLKTKYNLTDDACQHPEFFSLRPHNFPTIRLSQFAQLYHMRPNLLDKIRKAESLLALKNLLQTQASPYWNSHYTFGRKVAYSVKGLSDSFKDILLLNAVFPVLICHGASVGKAVHLSIKQWAEQMKAEENKVIRIFKKEGILSRNTLESQAIIHLYSNFCRKNKCLQCHWGSFLLYGK